MNIRVKNNTTCNYGTSIVLLWDEVMDIFPITYRVSIREYDLILINNANNPWPTITITRVIPGVSYHVTIAAINTCCGAGPVGNFVYIPPIDGHPAPPSTTGNLLLLHMNIQRCAIKIHKIITISRFKVVSFKAK